MRLHIANSDPTMRDNYERFFSGERCEVETVGDGVQCLNAARDCVPHVLVLEYELPWGGGDGVLARLREEIPLASINVVLITSDHSEEELAHSLAPPVVGCLRKPFRLRELSDLIRSVTQPSRRRMAGGSLKELNVPSRRAAQH